MRNSRSAGLPQSNRFMKPATRLASVLSLVLMLSITACAYTVVMRGGRRIEIPAQFSVTKTTLTYEAAPGIQITLQMAAIDIPATERANNEAPGSLLRRVGAITQVASKSEKSGRRARAPSMRRSITNRDFESYMRARRESERAYEKLRIELGLPSVEESRQSAAAEAEAIRQELGQKRSEERETESYWRSRASALRTEIAAVSAEISFIRIRLDEVPFSLSTGSFTVVSSILPFASIGRFVVSPSLIPPVASQPSVFVAPGGPQFTGQVFVNPGSFVHTRPIAVVPPVLAFPNVTVFSSPFQPYDFFYARTVLVTRLNELLAIRAGLDARWRALEDEARRAGVPPGWLRP